MEKFNYLKREILRYNLQRYNPLIFVTVDWAFYTCSNVCYHLRNFAVIMGYKKLGPEIERTSRFWVCSPTTQSNKMDGTLIGVIRVHSAEEDIRSDLGRCREEFSNWGVSWFVPLTKSYSDCRIEKRMICGGHEERWERLDLNTGFWRGKYGKGATRYT
jgi:hypothetical protein